MLIKNKVGSCLCLYNYNTGSVELEYVQYILPSNPRLNGNLCPVVGRISGLMMMLKMYRDYSEG